MLPNRPHKVSAHALLIVLGLAVLIACELAIVGGYSSGNVRQAGRMTLQTHAAALAESAFARILTRLRSSGWAGRWFKSGPAVESDIPLHGGRFDTHVSDAPDADRTVEVWVRARREDSTATMVWRVRLRDDALDLRYRIVPEFFSYQPNDSSPPNGLPGDPVRERIDRERAEQRANRSRAVELVRATAGDLRFETLARGLGFSSPPAVPPNGFPIAGNPSLPQDVYLAALESPGAPPALPAEPPPASDLVTRFPSPVDFTAVLVDVFAAAGLPPPSAPGPAHFEDPVKAGTEWSSALAVTVSDVRDPRWTTKMDHCRIFLEELSKKAARGCSICQDAMARVTAYLEEVTARRVAAVGAVPPVGADVDPAPFDASAYSRVLSKYAEWWRQ